MSAFAIGRILSNAEFARLVGLRPSTTYLLLAELVVDGTG
jgi:DNA-binding IclR family transcriptional regulator